MAEGCIMGILLQQQLFVLSVFIAFKAVKYMQELISAELILWWIWAQRIQLTALADSYIEVILRETDEKCDKLNLRGQSPPLL